MRAVEFTVGVDSEARRLSETPSQQNGTRTASARLLTAAQVEAVLFGLLPAEQQTTLLQGSGPTDAVAVSILEMADVPGLRAEEILDVASTQLLANLSAEVGIPVSFFSSPALTTAVVSAPPPPTSISHSNGLTAGSAQGDGGMIVAVVAAGAMLFCAGLGVAFWSRRKRRRLQGGKGTPTSSTMEAIPAPNDKSASDLALAGLAEEPDTPAAPAKTVNMDLLFSSELTPNTFQTQIKSHLAPGEGRLERARAAKAAKAKAAKLPKAAGAESAAEPPPAVPYAEPTGVGLTIQADDADEGSDEGDDDESEGDLMAELNGLRHTRMSAIEECCRPASRLEQHREEHKRADELLQQQQSDAQRRSSLVSGLTPGGSRFYEPNSAENLALIREQALALTLHARRRAREKAGKAEGLRAPADLDSITGSIRASATLGGTMLTPGRSSRRSSESEDEGDADQWLVSVMSPEAAADAAASVAAASRVARARALTPGRRSTSFPAAPTGKGSSAANTASRVARARRVAEANRPDGDPSYAHAHSVPDAGNRTLSLRDLYSASEGASPTVRPKKPRSVMEIRRSNSLSHLEPPTATAAPKLDPNTEALHLAAMVGVPPPPPNPLTPEQRLSRSDSTSRMERVRSDRESRDLSRSNSLSRSHSAKRTPLRDADVAKPKPKTLDFGASPPPEALGNEPELEALQQHGGDPGSSNSSSSPVASGAERDPPSPESYHTPSDKDVSPYRQFGL